VLNSFCNFLNAELFSVKFQFPVECLETELVATRTAGARIMKNTSDFEQQAGRSIRASIAVKELLLGNQEILSLLARISELLIDAVAKGNKLILFGNGGSAADAQHIAAEFVGRFAFDRPALPALALSVNSSCVTAIGNDYGFDVVFSRQLEALAHRGDVAIGISTSGKSPNVLRAMATAKRIGLRTVGLTGSDGAKLAAAVDYCVCVPSTETPRIQECHILIGHVISELVEQAIFHEESCLSRSGRSDQT
jgi:D-sedoheptulose 7-phosphate isomerase